MGYFVEVYLGFLDPLILIFTKVFFVTASWVGHELELRRNSLKDSALVRLI